jgi:hypothetical protein
MAFWSSIDPAPKGRPGEVGSASGPDPAVESRKCATFAEYDSTTSRTSQPSLWTASLRARDHHSGTYSHSRKGDVRGPSLRSVRAPETKTGGATLRNIFFAPTAVISAVVALHSLSEKPLR